MKKMNIITNYTLKNFKENKGKSPLIILCVILTSFMIFLSLAVPTFFRNYQVGMQRIHFGSSDIVVNSIYNNPSRFGDFALLQEDQEVMSKCKYAVPAFIINSDVFVGDKKEFKNSIVFGADIDELNKINPISFASKPVDKIGNFEVVVHKDLAENLNLKIGDVISLSRYSINSNLQVRVIGFANTSSVWASDGYRTILMNKRTMQELAMFYVPNLFNVLYIELNDYNDIGLVSYKLKEIYPFFDISEVVNETKTDSAVNQALIPFRVSAFVVSAFCFLILILIMNLIFYSRTKQFATLSTLGATKKQLLGSLLFESFIYGIIGSSITLVLTVLAVLIIPAVSSFYYISNVAWWKYLISFIFGILTPMLVSLFPALRTLRVSIRQTMVKVKSSLKMHIAKAIILIVMFVFGAIVCIVNPIGQNLYLSTISVICMVLAGILLTPYIVNFFSKMLTKIRYLKDTSFTTFYIKNSSTEKSVKMVNRILCMGIYTMLLLGFVIGTVGVVAEQSINIKHQYYLVNNLESYSQDVIDDIASIDGVKHVTPSLKNNWVTLEGYDVWAYGVDAYTLEDIDRIYGDKIENKEEVLKRLDDAFVNYAILNVSYKYLSGIEVGDVITICPGGLKDNAYNITVAGFVDMQENYTYTLTFNIDAFKRINHVREPNVLYLEIEEEKFDSIKSQIASKYSEAIVLNKRAYTNNILKELQIPITIFKIYIAFVALLCLISLTIGIVLSLKNNTANHRIMFLLGMSKWKFIMTFMIQILFTILVSLIVALSLIGLSLMQFKNIVLMLGMYIELSLNINTIVAIILLFALASLLITFLSIRKHNKEYSKNV